MKRHIKAIYFKYLNGEQQYQYLSDCNKLLIEMPVAKTAVSAYYPVFLDLLEREFKIIDTPKSSVYTQQIADADINNDSLITAIINIVNANLLHYDADKVAAARKIHNRLKAFGEIPMKSYEAEATAISILVSDLNSTEYSDAVEELDLVGWVTQLSASLTNFQNLLRLREIEASKRPSEKLGDVRKLIENTYQDMITILESQSILNPSAYAVFVSRLNVLVTYYNDHNSQPGKKQIRFATVDQIPEQVYTGKVITPIPNVYFDDKELAFAKDFVLTYKDNINAGVATVNIRGKELYTGIKKVTFNIYREDQNK
ncbi:MAG: DUF6261 family protein [Dysgonamonadaceae bacterium]|jgi:hypothetical protein|nr:DUF6261 family protein [Dysgonamonadaceae bacterium]